MSSITYRRQLPPFLTGLLASPPQRGEGLHRWVFAVARQMHAHASKEEITAFLSDLLQDRGLKPGEIEDAVRNSEASAWRPGCPTSLANVAKRWSPVDEELRQEVLKCGCGLAGLMEASPVPVIETPPTTEELIDNLFPGNPLLCCGASASLFATRPRGDWRGSLAAMQFIVPSPMSSPTGLTKEGKPSPRCLANTGGRRFLVVEFDRGTLNEHATILLHLAMKGPLALAVHSGGKSLHGWFPCAGRADDDIRGFFNYAVRLGADPATFSRCQQVRMPGGTRDNGAKQQVHFFNPGVLQ